MGAIAIGTCTVSMITPMQGIDFWTVVTPDTVDADDTVDVSSVVDTIYDVSVVSATDGVFTTTSTTAGVVDLAGATDNEERTIYIWGRKK